MHTTEIDPLIKKIIRVYYRVGFWHQGEIPTDRELKVKIFYSIYMLLFFWSLAIGGIVHEEQDESIYIAEMAIGFSLLVFKGYILVWKQKETERLLDRVCVFTVHDDEDIAIFYQRLSPFIKFCNAFLLSTMLCLFCQVAVYPFIGSEKTLFVKIAFPLNYRDSDISFCIANMFMFIATLLAVATVSFGVIILYLLLVCSARYELLGSDMVKMGQRATGEILDCEKQQIYCRDLIVSINGQLNLKQAVDELAKLFSTLFLLQVGLSVLTICGAIYSVLFTATNNLLGILIQDFIGLFSIADIFMICYLGNEIMLSSGRLTYYLFESAWHKQPQSTKKLVLIFAEYLKQPQVLVIGKLYPLTLETFTQIVNTAYSTFNILKSFK